MHTHTHTHTQRKGTRETHPACMSGACSRRRCPRYRHSGRHSLSVTSRRRGIAPYGDIDPLRRPSVLPAKGGVSDGVYDHMHRIAAEGGSCAGMAALRLIQLTAAAMAGFKNLLLELPQLLYGRCDGCPLLLVHVGLLFLNLLFSFCSTLHIENAK